MKQFILSCLLIWSCIVVGHAQQEIMLIKVKKEGKLGFLDENGKEVMPCQFDYLGIFSEGLVNARIGTNWYYYDYRGQKILDLGERYDECGQFHEGKAIAYRKPKEEVDAAAQWTYYNFIDRAGTEILQLDNDLNIFADYPRSLRFSDGLLQFRTYKYAFLNGYLNEKGAVVIPPMFYNQYLIGFQEGLAATSIYPYSQYKRNTKFGEGGLGFINKKGIFAIPPRYHHVLPFNNGAATVTMEHPNHGGWETFLIDKKGEKIFSDSIYTDQNLQRDSMVGIFMKKDGLRHRYALAKTNGEMITDFEYKEIRVGKLWAALKQDKVGFLNDEGKTVIPFDYYWANTLGFKGGVSIVSVNQSANLLAVINTENEVIIPPTPNAHFYNKNGIIQRFFLPMRDDNEAEYYNNKGERIDLSGYQLAGATDKNRFQRIRIE